jgi:predicted phosphate transport protein (TIGR00153 family)
MGLQSVLRLLLPKEEHFYDILEQHIALVHQCAQAMQALTQPGAKAEAICLEVQRLEHEADACHHRMMDALSATFVTPIDREDLQRLSKRIDDIADFINGAARACVLFGVDQPTVSMGHLIRTLPEVTALLQEAVPRLRRRNYPEIIRICSQVRSHEKDGDAVFRSALRALFHDPGVDAKTILREREVLEDLEKALNRSEVVAELLTSIAVKNA